MIVDAHAHILPDEAGIALMNRYAREAHLDGVVLVPGGMVNPRALANFLRGTEPLMRDEPPNDFVLETAARLEVKAYPFIQVNPQLHDLAYVQAAVARGAAGLKLNPVVDRLAFADDELTDIFAFAEERRMVVYTHILLNRSASIAELESRVRQFPNLPMVIGHMGFGTSDPEATRMAIQHENVYLETSVGAFLAIEDAVRRAGPEKILFGSEAPAHHPRAEWEKVDLLHIPAAHKDLIGGGNMLRLLERAGTA